MKCIETYLDNNKFIINKFFTVSQIAKENLCNHPLFLATDIFDKKCDSTENLFNNSNQIIRLDQNNPFYELHYNKDDNSNILRF